MEFKRSIFPRVTKVITASAVITTALIFVLAGCGGGQTTTTHNTTTSPVTTTESSGMTFPAGKYVHNDDFYGVFGLAYTVTDDGIISIGIKAKTLGWVALALGSPHGQSDIIIGYVSGGQVSLYDSHNASESGGHPLDTDTGGTNDLYNISGSESNGITTIEFKRKLDTMDVYDLPLITGQNVVTWAFGISDNIFEIHIQLGIGFFEIPELTHP